MSERLNQPEEEIGVPEEKYKGHQTWQEAEENPEELYTAKEIFDLILYNDFYKVNPEKMKQGLLEKGLKEEDIDLSLKLAVCMGKIDEVVNEGKNIGLNFFAENDKNLGTFAMYHPKQEGFLESYSVNVKNLNEDMMENLKNRKNHLIDNNGKFIKDPPKITIEEYLLGVAVHEVRHRLQAERNIEMFSEKDTSSGDKQLNKIVKFVKSLLKVRSDIMEKEGKTEDDIKDRTNEKEFDSNVVQYLTYNKVHTGITLQEFFELVKTNPE